MLHKLLLKELFNKTAEATGDLIGNMIVDEITSPGRSEKKGKEEHNEVTEMQ